MLPRGRRPNTSCSSPPGCSYGCHPRPCATRQRPRMRASASSSNQVATSGCRVMTETKKTDEAVSQDTSSDKTRGRAFGGEAILGRWKCPGVGGRGAQLVESRLAMKLVEIPGSGANTIQHITWRHEIMCPARQAKWRGGCVDASNAAMRLWPRKASALPGRNEQDDHSHSFCWARTSP